MPANGNDLVLIVSILVYIYMYVYMSCYVRRLESAATAYSGVYREHVVSI